jgi:TIR domain
MNVFISHINEEAPFAMVLKDWIESTFLGTCTVFVSSDANSLPAGTRWLEQMDAALRAAKVMVVLCSDSSVQRPWVNFETGCAWARNIPVIPVCHTGLTKGNLPRPLAEFQALDATEPGFPTSLVSALAKLLGVSKLPRLDTSAMSKESTAALVALAAGSKLSTRRIGGNEAASAEPQPAVASEGVAILKFLSEQTRPCEPPQLAQVIGANLQKTEYFLDQLRNAKLVSMSLHMGRGASYSLSKEGRDFIFGGSAA